MNVIQMAADISTPEDATVGTVRRAAVTTAEVWAIPAEWKGKIVDFKFYDSALTTRAYIRFGTSASVSVDATTASGLDGSHVLTAGTAEPHIELEAGQSQPERIDASWTHLAHLESATGGFLMGTLRTGRNPLG